MGWKRRPTVLLLATALACTCVANLLLVWAVLDTAQPQPAAASGDAAPATTGATQRLPLLPPVAAVAALRVPDVAATVPDPLPIRAARLNLFGPPEALSVEETLLPFPAAGDVTVALAFAGVNQVDAYIRAGEYAELPLLPATLGTEGAGTVARLGAGVTGFAVGDRVYVTTCRTGSYATACNAAADDVHLLPASVPLELGCGLGVPYPAAYRAMFQQGGARAGQSVLVTGASGAVGLAAVQLAAAAGLSVIATAGTAAGCALATAAGAHHVLDHHDPGCAR